MMKTSSFERNSRAVVCSLFGLAALAAGAGTWTIQPEDVDGMTPSQQLTNAVKRAANDDTVLFKTGTYQLDDESFMFTVTGAAKDTTVTSRSYVYLTNKKLHFVGEAEGTWSNGVVLRGNGKFRFARMTNTGTTFRNITFENFASCDHPEMKVNDNNLDATGLGGVIHFSAWNDANVASNCVFRGNAARGGGATAYLFATDCFYTNNVAYWGGGADLSSSLTRCTFAGNRAVFDVEKQNGLGGATCWTRSLSGCTFAGNSSDGYAGAVVGDLSMVATDCVFSNNVSGAEGGVMTLRRKTQVSRCVFSGNSAGTGGGAIASWGQQSNGGANGGAGSVFTDCLFAQNTAKRYGGAVYALVPDADGPVQFRSCVFTGNYAPGTGGYGGCATYGGAYSNCTFSGHLASNATATTKGGIVYGGEEGPVPVVDCVFSNNYGIADGLVYKANCTNTLFYGNEVPKNCGVVKNCTATDCRFVGNRKYDTFCGIVTVPNYTVTPEANNPSGDAIESTLVKCDMDLGGIWNCVLVDCHIHTLTNKGAYCVFNGHNVATNCLIEGCNPPDQGRGIIYRWGSSAAGLAYISGSDYVNCTFAENTVPCLLHHAQEQEIVTPFKNCLFYNNRDRSGNLVDANFRIHATNRGDLTNLDSGMEMSNCVFGAISPYFSGDTWRDLGGNKVVAPGKLLVVGARAAALGAHKYSLRAESPAIGIGDASMFAADDLDYAGNLRLRDGRLDPGCFECWLDPLGTAMFIR